MRHLGLNVGIAGLKGTAHTQHIHRGRWHNTHVKQGLHLRAQRHTTHDMPVNTTITTQQTFTHTGDGGTTHMSSKACTCVHNGIPLMSCPSTQQSLHNKHSHTQGTVAQHTCQARPALACTTAYHSCHARRPVLCTYGAFKNGTVNNDCN
jgi:hypothetical protein